MKAKYPGTFAEECGKFGSKVPNFQKEAIEKFCCKKCKVLRVKNAKAPSKAPAKAPAKAEPSTCEDRLVVRKAIPPDFYNTEFSQKAVPAENNDKKAYGVRIPG